MVSIFSFYVTSFAYDSSFFLHPTEATLRTVTREVGREAGICCLCGNLTDCGPKEKSFRNTISSFAGLWVLLLQFQLCAQRVAHTNAEKHFLLLECDCAMGPLSMHFSHTHKHKQHRNFLFVYFHLFISLTTLVDGAVLIKTKHVNDVREIYKPRAWDAHSQRAKEDENINERLNTKQWNRKIYKIKCLAKSEEVAKAKIKMANCEAHGNSNQSVSQPVHSVSVEG